MRYVQDKDGNPVDGDRAGFIRGIANGIWRALADRGVAPRTWKRGPLHIQESYNREMATRFPELRLCSQDWKAEQIAIDNYPAFHGLRFPEDKKEKEHVKQGEWKSIYFTGNNISV